MSGMIPGARREWRAAAAAATAAAASRSWKDVVSNDSSWKRVDGEERGRKKKIYTTGTPHILLCGLLHRRDTYVPSVYTNQRWRIDVEEALLLYPIWRFLRSQETKSDKFNVQCSAKWNDVTRFWLRVVVLLAPYTRKSGENGRIFFFGYVGTFTYWLGSSVCDDEEDWASIIFY